MLPYAAYAITLVPQCGGTGQPECQACHLVQLGSNIITFLVSIAAGIGAVVFAVAGFRMAASRGNESELTAAKGMMTNVVVGFIILMASWLIVDTVMKQFVDTSIFKSAGFGTWNNIKCEKLPEYNETGPDVIVAADEYTPATAGVSKANSEAEAYLKASGANIDIKPGASLEGIKQSTLDGVVNLSLACGCPITITEGTGGTHAAGTFSHANGYKVDLRTNGNQALLDYVTKKSGASYVTDTAYGPLYKAGYTTYIIEKDHLDVQFKTP